MSRWSWIAALTVAVALGLNRVFVDVLVPPHLRWWFTGAVVFVNSMLTSAYWITRVRRAAATHSGELSQTSNEGDNQ